MPDPLGSYRIDLWPVTDAAGDRIIRQQGEHPHTGTEPGVEDREFPDPTGNYLARESVVETLCTTASSGPRRPMNFSSNPNNSAATT